MDNEMTNTFSSQCGGNCIIHCKRKVRVDEDDEDYFKYYGKNRNTRSTSSESKVNIQDIKSETPYLSNWNGKVVKALISAGAKVKENDDLFVLNLKKEDAYFLDYDEEESSSFDSPQVSESVKSKEDTGTISSSAAATSIASNFSVFSVIESIKTKSAEEYFMRFISSRVDGGRSSKVFDDAGGRSDLSSGKEYGVTNRIERVSSGKDNTLHMTNSAANVNGTMVMSNGSYLHKLASELPTPLVPEKESEVKLSAPKLDVRSVPVVEFELNLSPLKLDVHSVHEEESELNLSAPKVQKSTISSHRFVTFTDYCQVPENYKTQITFGSFDASPYDCKPLSVTEFSLQNVEPATGPSVSNKNVSATAQEVEFKDHPLTQRSENELNGEIIAEPSSSNENGSATARKGESKDHLEHELPSQDDNIAAATQSAADSEVYDNRPYLVKADFGSFEVTQVLFKEGMEVKQLQPLFRYKSEGKERKALYEFQTDDYLDVDRAQIEKYIGVPIYYPQLKWPAEVYTNTAI